MLWYEILFLICAALLFVQSVLALIGLDFDGFEFDGPSSDLLSFKGLLHFLTGFSATYCFLDKVTVWTTLTALIVGIVCVAILNWLYKAFAKHLTQEIEYTENIPKQLVEIYSWNGTSGECTIILEGVAKQIPVISDTHKDLRFGDRVYVEGNRHLVKIVN